MEMILELVKVNYVFGTDKWKERREYNQNNK